MAIKTNTTWPTFGGQLLAKIPTPTFSGRLTDDASDSINPYTSSGPGEGGAGQTWTDVYGGGGYVDPYFDNVVLQLRMDEAAGSTTFVDSSSYSNTVSTVGSVTATDFTAPLSGNSAYMNSGYLSVSIGAGDPLQLGTADYTIDFWYYRTANRVENLYSFVNGPGQLFWSNQTLYFQPTPGSSAKYGNSGISPGTWNHYALERVSGSTQMYLNGTPFLTPTTNTNNYSSLSSIRIGGGPNYGAVIGYMADFRVTAGVARYNGAYDEPTQRI